MAACVLQDKYNKRAHPYHKYSTYIRSNKMCKEVGITMVLYNFESLCLEFSFL